MYVALAVIGTGVMSTEPMPVRDAARSTTACVIEESARVDTHVSVRTRSGWVRLGGPEIAQGSDMCVRRASKNRPRRLRMSWYPVPTRVGEST